MDGDQHVPEEEQHPTVTFVPVDPDEPALSQPGDVDGIEGFALVVDRGPRAGLTWILEPGVTTIGRGPDQDIFLDDVTVSRRHAELTVGVCEPNHIKDAGSTNGIYINGERLDEAPVAAGDEIIIGKYHLLLVHGDG
ncbi:MAG: FHA domain-containing protein [Acidimicrobiia bacterium]|nr:MAG: FHA domain-containing protein [Acidimicrobiia bacterium]